MHKGAETVFFPTLWWMSLERVNALLAIRVYRVEGTTISPTMRVSFIGASLYEDSLGGGGERLEEDVWIIGYVIALKYGGRRSVLGDDNDWW